MSLVERRERLFSEINHVCRACAHSSRKVLFLLSRYIIRCGIIRAPVGLRERDRRDGIVVRAATSEYDLQFHPVLATLYYVYNVPREDALGIGVQPTSRNVTSSSIDQCGCHS